MVPSGAMTSLPTDSALVPVWLRSTSSPAAFFTVSEATVLWEWPSSITSMPVVLAMTSVDIQGEL